MALGTFFNNMSIAKKMTVIIAAVALATGLVGGVVSSFIVKEQVIAGIEEDIRHQADRTAEKVSLYLENIKSDLLHTASVDVTADALEKFTIAWSKLESPQKNLQDFYIHKNENPLGQKDKLNAANDGSYYSELHRYYHRAFLTQKDVKGYYDIFLINKNGDVVYSVYKENDFATNMNNGQWHDTDLAQAFREINASSQKGKSIFKDFREYAVSNNIPSSFIATPVYRGDEYIGVVAFQMSAHSFSNLFQSNDKNQGAYLIGFDSLLRNDLSATPENDILKTKSKLTHISESQKRFLSDSPGLLFPRSTYNIQKVSFLGTDWAVVIEHNQAPIDTKKLSVTLYFLIATLLSSCVVACLGFLYTRNSFPISKLASTVDKKAS